MIHLNNEKAKRAAERKEREEKLMSEKAKSKAREQAKRKAEARRKKAELARQKIEVGTKVRLKTSKQNGVVEAIEGQKVTVVFGMMKTIASAKDLLVVEKKKVNK